MSVYSSVERSRSTSTSKSANLTTTPSRKKVLQGITAHYTFKIETLSFPFPVPLFRTSTEENLRKKRLLTEDKIYGSSACDCDCSYDI